MKKNKKVSIVVPVYNCEKYLPNCIDSLLSQTYSNVEIILVDDGSTDKSFDICEMYRQQSNKVIVIKQENFGAPSARNNGLRHSTGDFIMFFDSDDLLENNAITIMCKNFDDSTDLVIGACYEIDEDGKIVNIKPHEPKVKLILNKYNVFSCDPFPGNKLYKTNIIKNNNIYFGNVRIGQDLNFYLKYLSVSKNVKIIDNNVSKYRILNTGISKTKNFRIFDIIESFNDVRTYYKKRNALSEINSKLINSIESVHIIRQMGKLRFYNNYSDRKLIFNYFSYFFKLYKNNNILTRKELRLLKLKYLYLRIYSFFKII